MTSPGGFGYNQSPYMNNGPGLLGNQPAVNMMAGQQLPHQFGHAMANVGRMGGAWAGAGFGDMSAGAGYGGSPGFMGAGQFGAQAGMGGGGFGGGGAGPQGGGYRGGGGRGGGYGGGFNRRGGGG